jgi:hypothetical protein
MKNLIPWMITLTLAVCLFFVILLLGACQTPKVCRIECMKNNDAIPLCEEICEK